MARILQQNDKDKILGCTT